MRGTTPGLFFIDRDGQGITKVWFMDQLRSILADVGVPQNQYSIHSFPIGAATSAALAGVEDSNTGQMAQHCLPPVHSYAKEAASTDISSPSHTVTWSCSV